MINVNETMKTMKLQTKIAILKSDNLTAPVQISCKTVSLLLSNKLRIFPSSALLNKSLLWSLEISSDESTETLLPLISETGAPTHRLSPPSPRTVEKNQNVSSSSSPRLLEGRREVAAAAAAAGDFISGSEQLPSHRSKSWSAIQTDGGDKRPGSTRLSDNQFIKRYRGGKKETKAAAMIRRHVAHRPSRCSKTWQPNNNNNNNNREIISSCRVFC